MKLTWQILKDTIESFIENRCIKFSAALAYYTVFSLPPMLIVLISIGGFFYKKQHIREEVFTVITSFVGIDTADRVQEVLDNISLNSDNTWATVFGVGLVIFGSSRIFAEIQDSINLIWGLKAKPTKSWLTLIVNRLVSFSMILVLGFILLVSLTVNTVLDILLEKLTALLPDQNVIFIYLADQLLVLTVIVLLFTLIFRVLPDAVLRWKDAMVGAGVTTILFLIGKYLISLYLTDTYIVSAYGATGSLIVLLLWVYYSAIILYFGAEFTKAYADNLGHPIQPNQFAVRVNSVQEQNQDNPMKPE